MPDFTMRLIGIFGKREIELAAIWILDKGLHRAVVQDRHFEGASQYEQDGYRMMKECGLLISVRAGWIVSDEFKRRVNVA